MIWVIIIVLIVCVPVYIIVVKQPAIIPQLSLDNQNDDFLSSSLNNYIAPIIGIITIILVFVTYQKQRDSVSSQREQHNFEVALKLFENLDNEISKLYFSKANCTSFSTGHIAFNEMIALYEKGLFQAKEFGAYNYGRMLASLCYSFKSLEYWIKTAHLSTEKIFFLNSKLNAFYRARFAINFYRLNKSFEKYPDMKDIYAHEIINLVKSYDIDNIEDWLDEYIESYN